MRVRELIEKLQSMPQDSFVYVNGVDVDGVSLDSLFGNSDIEGILEVNLILDNT